MTTETDQSVDGARRAFLRSTAGVVGVGVLAGTCVPRVHAGGGDTLLVGLVGCGGRGTGAALDAMAADENVKLVAMGDVFRDQLESSRNRLRGPLGKKFAVDDAHSFAGFDAYRHVIDSVDVVLLATPPGFRPRHLEYAVKQGKHAFVEKPVAVDAPGVRSVLASCAEAKKRNLSIVSGLCWRYHDAMRETIKRVQDGAVGDIVTLQCDYNTQRPRQLAPRQSGWSDMEFQLRNWYFYTWLSGDHNVEQHVHSLDKMAWVLGDAYPVSAYGMGGRQAIADEEPGHIFDHHAVCYEFPKGVRCYSLTRQQTGTFNGTHDWVFGTKGTALLMEFKITGANAWSFGRRQIRGINMFQQEHRELFASIRSGRPINNGDYMAKSTMMAILGRMATYTGQLITWDQAMASHETLAPRSLDWTSLPEPAVAIPGVTKFS
jgi:predicted dehydrogenase